MSPKRVCTASVAWLVCVLALVAGTTSCKNAVTTDDAPPAITLPEPAPLPGYNGDNVFQIGSVTIAGQPDEQALREAAAMGVTTVVNLRAEAESASVGFDEAALVEALGMVYVTIPMTPASFNADDVARFANVLADSEGAPLLVHCSSSNRAGGMWAAYLALHRSIPEPTALRAGRAAGMSKAVMIGATQRVVRNE